MVIQLGYLSSFSVSALALVSLSGDRSRSVKHRHLVGFSTGRRSSYVGKLLASAFLTATHLAPRYTPAVTVNRLPARLATLEVASRADLDWFDLVRRDARRGGLRFLTDPGRHRSTDVGRYSGYTARQTKKGSFTIRGDLREFTDALRRGGLLQMGNFSGWRVVVNSELTQIGKLGFAAFAASATLTAFNTEGEE